MCERRSALIRTLLVSVGFTNLLLAFTGDLRGSPTSDGERTASTIHVATTDEHAYALAWQPDGKIVAVGSVYDGAHSDFALARYTLDDRPLPVLMSEARWPTLLPRSLTL